MAEVIWREIAAVARAMLLTAKLPADLWHLAYDHSVWLRQRMPHIENDMKIPFCEVFPTYTLDLSDVRVFGCNAYSWLDPDQRYNQQPDVSRHLANRSRPLIYVGHSDTSASWLLYDLDTHKMILTGRPKFIEQFDKLGRRISFPITDSIIDDHRRYTQLPDGFREHMNIGVRPFTVSDHSVFFDSAENEMTCIVKIHTLNDQTGTWTYLHEVISSSEQFKTVTSYLQSYYQQGNLNNYYPLFSVCSASPDGYRRYFSCIISSVDLSLYSDTEGGGDSLAYGVTFNPKHHFDLGITAVSRNMLRFTDIATASVVRMATAFLCASTTEEKLTKYLNYVPPKSYLEALSFLDAEHWIKATGDELQQMLDMGVFEFMGPNFQPKGKHFCGYQDGLCTQDHQGHR